MPDRSDGSALPTDGLAAPARRALDGAGITTLEQLAHRSAADLEERHGVGPNAIETLREALEAHGLSFRASNRE